MSKLIPITYLLQTLKINDCASKHNTKTTDKVPHKLYNKFSKIVKKHKHKYVKNVGRSSQNFFFFIDYQLFVEAIIVGW